jgi:hypothetical protein
MELVIEESGKKLDLILDGPLVEQMAQSLEDFPDDPFPPVGGIYPEGWGSNIIPKHDD